MRLYGENIENLVSQNVDLAFPMLYTKILPQNFLGSGEGGFVDPNQTPHNVASNEGLHCLCRPRWLSWIRRPTGDQEVTGSTPADVGNILSWRLIMKYFLQSFSPFR